MTPLTNPQVGSPSVRADQLTLPTRARSLSSNTGPPESPLQTPKPAASPSFCGSMRLNCCELGRSVATSVTARSLPAVLRSPCTPTPKPATMNRSPTDGGTRRSLNATGVRFATGAASLTRAKSGASARGENCGCAATPATSFTSGRRPSNVTSRYLPALGTQCVAVKTRSGAIATPVHRLRAPTMMTTGREIAWSAKGAPPTMAAVGPAASTSNAKPKSAADDLALNFEQAIGAGSRLGTVLITKPDRSLSRPLRRAGKNPAPVAIRLDRVSSPAMPVPGLDPGDRHGRPRLY